MGKFRLITKGLVKENPTFVLLLGMCPTLATTTSAINGMGMGLATMFVLVLSNMAISATAPYIPDKVRIPAYIVIIAAFVTVLTVSSSDAPKPLPTKILSSTLPVTVSV